MIDPLGNVREFIDHPFGNFRQQVYLPPPPSEISKKNCNPLENYKKMLTPSEIFLSQSPSEISTWHPLRNSEFQTPFGNSNQQGGVDINGSGIGGPFDFFCKFSIKCPTVGQ